MKNLATLSLLTLTASALLVAGVVSSSIDAESHDAGSATVIRGVRVFDGEKVIPKTTVVFERGTITAVGDRAEVPAGAEVIDGSGSTLLPGLIDAHTHAWGDALERALVFGVTTEIDMFTSPDFANPAREEQRRAFVTSRSDIVSAGVLVTVPGGHGTEYFPIPTIDERTDIQEFIDARIAEGSEFIKIVYDDGSAYGLSFSTFDFETLKNVIDAAHARNMMAVVHIGTARGAREAIEAGADGLVHLFRDRGPDDGFAKLAKKKGVFVIATTTVIESTAGRASGKSLIDDPHIGPYLSSTEKARLEATFPRRIAGDDSLEPTFEAIRQLTAAGVPILAGTDAPNPGTTHGASIHRDLELLVEAGLSPLQALTAATSAPADAFHLDDRGRIRKGLRADLLLVRGDPTSNIKATRDITSVWKAGARLDRRPIDDAVSGVPAPFAGDDWGAVSNFDDGTMSARFGSGWSTSTDALMGGESTAAIEVVDGALRVRGEVVAAAPYRWAGAMFMTGAQPFQPADLSSKRGVSFRIRGDVESATLMVFARRLGRIPATKTIEVGPDWSRVTFEWKSLAELDGGDIQAILISAGQEPGEFEIFVDDVELLDQ